MAFFWDELDFLEGGRFTTLRYMSLRQWPDELDDQVVILGQFLWLPPGQDVDVESDFVASRLPYHRAIFGGLDNEDDPWLFSLQMVPRSVVRQAHGPEVGPFDLMRDAMTNALVYNGGAVVGAEIEWDKGEILALYASQGIDAWRITGWRTYDLIRGLLAELTGVELRDVVRGYPSCAFPDRAHACQRDVFTDVFSAWVARQLS